MTYQNIFEIVILPIYDMEQRKLAFNIPNLIITFDRINL